MKDKALAKAKAFDAGQAAQKYNVPLEACPFEEGTDEHEAYMEGFNAKLAEKWNPLDSKHHYLEIAQ